MFIGPPCIDDFPIRVSIELGEPAMFQYWLLHSCGGFTMIYHRGWGRPPQQLSSGGVSPQFATLLNYRKVDLATWLQNPMRIIVVSFPKGFL